MSDRLADCGCVLKVVEERWERIEQRLYGEDDDGNTLMTNIPVKGGTLRTVIDSSNCQLVSLKANVAELVAVLTDLCGGTDEHPRHVWDRAEALLAKLRGSEVKP